MTTEQNIRNEIEEIEKQEHCECVICSMTLDRLHGRLKALLLAQSETKLKTNIAKLDSSLKRDINRIKKNATNYYNKLKDYKGLASQIDTFTKMLLIEKRTTKEELSKYFKRREKHGRK